jgi:hypothetical protein
MSEKFEKHNDMLFRILDEPVPLTDDAELPVLVRLIQDDTMLGKANKNIYHPNTLAKKIICSKLTDGGLFLGGNYAYRYEIIGTFVKEGSADWAWHMMQEGYKTKHCESTSQRFYAIRKGNNYCAFYDNEWKEVDINTRRIYCEFIEYAKAFPGYGWRILKEHEQPKPESENIIHHIPADMHLKYFHLCKFKVGDWVEFIDAGGHKSQGKYLSKAYDNAILVLDITYNMRCVVPTTKVIRKLSPSEVVIRIGCLSGTVKDLSYVEDGRFWFISKETERCPGGMHAILYGEMLDTPTREIVESLLKAQEEE